MKPSRLSILQISETVLFIDASAYKETMSNNHLQLLIATLHLDIQKHNKDESSLPSASIIELVPGMYNLTLFLSQDHNISALKEAIECLWRKYLNLQISGQTIPQIPEGKEIIIPTVYGLKGSEIYGPDLALVAKHNQLTIEQVVKLHSQATYQVYFIGFQPGFAYLGGLDPRLYTPRRSVPREKIPKGSVAIGGEQTGIYPAATPGGWQIIGQTQLPLFNANDSKQICLLQSGDRVKFKAVNQDA